MEMAPNAANEPVLSIAESGDRLRGVALATVLIAILSTLLLAALDQTIVGTALPHIIADLHGFDRYTWVATSYLLTSTTMTPIVGKLSDQFGRKWFLISGVVIFLLGSALSGAAQDINQLIIFRGLQGIGAGMMMALVFTLVGDIFAPAERARWQGLFSAVFGLSSVIGPVAGGWISDNISWRWVFYVNLPLGILALVMLVIWLPSNISARSAARNIDFGGALTAAGATVCLLLGLTWGGQSYPWNSPQVIGTLSASGVLYIAFIIIERLVPEPILSLNLFRSQVFASGAVLALLSGVSLFATVFYLPLYVQGVLGQAATNSGVITTPLVLTLAIGAAVVGQVIARIGRYQIIAIIGSVIMIIGGYLLTLMGTGTTTLEVTRNMIVLGLGIGMVFPVLTLATQNAIPRNRLGAGTAAITYLRSLGSTLGVAVIGTIVNNTLTSELPKHLPAGAAQLPPAVLAAATNQQVLVSAPTRAGITAQVVQGAVGQATASIPAGPLHDSIAASVTQQTTALMQGIFDAARQSFATGLQNGFYVALGIAGLSLIATFFLKDIPLSQRAQPASPVTEAIDLEELTGPVPVYVGEFDTTANGRLPELGAYTPRPRQNGQLPHNDPGRSIAANGGLPPRVQPNGGAITSEADWLTRYEQAKQELEDVIAAFYLTHPGYLPQGQRSAIRQTMDLMQLDRLDVVERAMSEVAHAGALDAAPQFDQNGMLHSALPAYNRAQGAQSDQSVLATTGARVLGLERNNGYVPPSDSQS